MIDQWYDPDATPRNLFEMLGSKADERRKFLFKIECDELFYKKVQMLYGVRLDISEWIKVFDKDDRNNIVKKSEACDIIRCLWPNPVMENPLIDPRWKTDTVIELARQIHESPTIVEELNQILADALMDAGCDNEAILRHLRLDLHVSGKCWLIRELLGEQT